MKPASPKLLDNICNGLTDTDAACLRLTVDEVRKLLAGDKRRSLYHLIAAVRVIADERAAEFIRTGYPKVAAQYAELCARMRDNQIDASFFAL